MIASMHLKCVLPKANLILFVEGEVMPGHLHGQIGTGITTEKFIKLRLSMIKLLIRRLDVNCIFAEAIRRLTSVSLIPAIRDSLHEMFKGFECKVHGLLMSIGDIFDFL